MSRQIEMAERLVKVEEKVKDIPHIKEKIDEVHTKLDTIHEHNVLTKVKVDRLQKVSIGRWISEHPLKFAFYLVVVVLALQSEARTGGLDMVKKIWLGF